jgi:predicted nucleic acid-binding protein
VTLAELVCGPAATNDSWEQRRRRDHLQSMEAEIEALDFDCRCAHAYGEIHAATHKVGRKPRGARALDLLIAATALAHEIPIYTLNAADLRGLDGLIEIVDLG